MKAFFGLGVFGGVAVALLTEVLNVVMTFGALEHVASYNAWMTM